MNAVSTVISRRSIGVGIEERERSLHRLEGVGDPAREAGAVVLQDLVERVRDELSRIEHLDQAAHRALLALEAAAQGRKPSRNRSVAGMK